jgi:hypothetical protein
MRRALAIFSHSLGVHHPNTETVARNYRLLLAEMGEDLNQIRARLKDLGLEA